jgi:hypothetical protein
MSTSGLNDKIAKTMFEFIRGVGEKSSGLNTPSAGAGEKRKRTAEAEDSHDISRLLSVRYPHCASVL